MEKLGAMHIRDQEELPAIPPGTKGTVAANVDIIIGNVRRKLGHEVEVTVLGTNQGGQLSVSFNAWEGGYGDGYVDPKYFKPAENS